MQYPTSMQMGNRSIAVNVVDEPIVVTGRGNRDGNYVGMFNNKASTMTIMDGEALVHETIEAADVIYDLKLPHQTIQTLAVAMHQAFASGNVAFTQ